MNPLTLILPSQRVQADPNTRAGQGLPPAAPPPPTSDIDRPQLPLMRGTDLDKPHTYVIPTGIGTAGRAPTAPDGGMSEGEPQQIRHAPPGDPLQDTYYDRLTEGTVARQKTLQTEYNGPVPELEQTTYVVRYVMESTNPDRVSPRWTAHFAPPVSRYLREDNKRYPMYTNNGLHTNMSTILTNPLTRVRPATRNRVVTRTVPAPLDEQTTDVSRRSTNAVFDHSYSWR